jgi:hypothetical protein
MLTTAGTARATESAKLCTMTGARGAGDLGSGAGAVETPRNSGFHHTTRKAAARPTTTALSRKLARTRAFFNDPPVAALRDSRICV